MIVCPACGGNLKFHIPTQNMKCAFCDNSYDPYEFDSKDKDGIEQKDYDVTVFTCPQCGGEITSTDNEVTGFCPFCGASTIFYTRLEKSLKPNYIIPFKISKEDCKIAYQEKVSKMLFLPAEYKKSEYIDGFRGIYIPYWSYDVDEKGPFIIKADKDERHGDYIYHKHYDLKGNMDAFYHGINYDASSSFDDDISDRIAPFDVKEKKEFTAGFLSGFYADTADVPADVYHEEILDFVEIETLRQIGEVPEFEDYSVNDENHNIHVKLSNTDRTMFPVWFMSYRYKDRVAYATVNGQTGKVSADFPIDIKKFLIFAGILAAVIFTVLNVFLTLRPTVVSLIIFVLGLISMFLYSSEWKEIKNKENHVFDKGYNQGSDSVVEIYLRGKDQKMPILPILTSLIGAVMAIGVFALKLINDALVYGVNLLAAVGIGYTLVLLIKDYNVLSTRKLPQFDRKGGDDNA